MSARSPILPYNDHTSPAAEVMDQMTEIDNGLLLNDLDADGNAINNAVFGSPTFAPVSGIFPVISPENYGAVGNGTDDDGDAWRLLATAIADLGGARVVCKQDANYLLGSLAPGGGACIKLNDLSTASRVDFVGNGCKITTTLGGASADPVFYIDTQFDSITFEDFNVVRPADAVVYPGQFVTLNPYDTTGSNLIAVRNCNFNNVGRGVDVLACGPLKRGLLKRLEVIGNHFDYPWGSNASDTSGRPGVMCYNSWHVDTAVYEENICDGGADVSDAGNTPNGLPKDGFCFSESRVLIAKRNNVKNFWVEGIFHNTQGQFSRVTSDFVMPAVSANVTVNYFPFEDATTVLTALVGENLHIGNGSSPYLPAGQMKLISFNNTAHTMVVQNTGYSLTEEGTVIAVNATPGATIATDGYIGLIDPFDDVSSIIDDNDLDQAEVIGGPERHNPAIAAYFGTAQITNNRIKNAFWAISILGFGGVDNTQFTTNGYRSSVQGNDIKFDTWNATEGYGAGLRIGISCSLRAIDASIGSNTFKAATSKGVSCIVTGIRTIATGNGGIMDTLDANVSYPSFGIQVPNGAHGCVFTANHFSKLDKAHGAQSDGFVYKVVSYSAANCTKDVDSGADVGVVKAHFSAHHSGTQTIADSVYTALNMATEEEDTQGNFASPTFTAPRAGRYVFSGYARMGAPNANSSKLVIYHNGSIYRDLDQKTPTSLNDALTGSITMLLAIGDTVTLYGWQNSGGPLAIDAAQMGAFQGDEL